MIFTPHEYQIEAIRFLITTANAGLFFSPGLGKTACVLQTLSILKKKGVFRRALVVAPRLVATNVWPDEMRKWSSFGNLTLDVLHGPKKDDILANSTADVVVVTPEGLSWLAQDAGLRFAQVNADVLIIDESSYFRHQSSKRFKNIKAQLTTFSRRIILTGTPAPLGYQDLFTQIYILDMGGALGRYITHYRIRYFENTAPPGATYESWTPRRGAADEINEKLKPLVLRGDSLDYLDMPQLIPLSHVVDLPPEARKLYADYERHYYLCLDSGEEISSPNAAALGNKLRQIANGFAYDIDSNPVFLHDEKLEALEELVSSLVGEPALLAYEYDADKTRILDLFPKAVSLTDAKNTAPVIAAFNSGQIPLLVAHPASAGHGLNLQSRAFHVIWFGPTWNLEHAEQLAARIWRQGNPNRQVFVHTIVARGTKDEEVAEVLEQKDRTQKALLAALKRRPQPVVVAA